MENEPQPIIRAYKVECSTHGYLGEMKNARLALDLYLAHSQHELYGCDGYKVTPVFEGDKPVNIELFDIIPP